MIYSKYHNSLNYANLIRLCYKEINNVDKILKNNLVKIEKGERDTCGFKYFKDLDISIQGQDAKCSIKEVIRQCLINEINYDIQIELEDKKVLKLKN